MSATSGVSVKCSTPTTWARRFSPWVNRSLAERGVKCSTGTMVDATIIPTSSSTKNEAKERDPDMGSTKKNNNWHFGAKLHVGADVQTRVVHTVSVTSASVADVAEGPELMRPDDTLGLGDKGYAGMQPEGCQFHIPLKKNQFSEAAKEEAKAYNRKVSSLRARVEHVFHVLKCIFGAQNGCVTVVWRRTRCAWSSRWPWRTSTCAENSCWPLRRSEQNRVHRPRTDAEIESKSI